MARSAASFDQADSFTSQLLVVQLFERSLEAVAGSEFDDALAAAIAMRVAEGHFAHFPAKVLQILPRDGRREVFHDEAMFRANGRRATVVAAARRRSAESGVAVVPSFSIAAAAAAATSATAAAAGPLGEFDSYALAVETLAVEVLDRVLGVAEILELDKAETSLEDDVAQAPVTLEETFQVGLASALRESPNEKTSAHDWLFCGS